MLDEQETLCINAIHDILWCGTRHNKYCVYFFIISFILQVCVASQIFRRKINVWAIVFAILPIIILIICTIVTDRRTKRMTYFKLLEESETVNRNMQRLVERTKDMAYFKLLQKTIRKTVSWNMRMLVEQYFSSIRKCNVTYMFVAYYLLCPVLGYAFKHADNTGIERIVGGFFLLLGLILAGSVAKSWENNILCLTLRVVMKILPGDTSVKTFKDILKQLGYNISYDDVSWWCQLEFVKDI